MNKEYNIIQGDCRDVLKTMEDQSVNCCVTSPPYFGLRDYGDDGQVGLENSPDKYVEEMVCIFREVARVLKDNGTLWLNLGDSYSLNSVGVMGESSKMHTQYRRANEFRTRKQKITYGLKPKELVGIPWRVAFALQSDGWYLRQDIIWHKPNPMPESVTDRCTKSHEYIFLLSKNSRYYYDYEAIREESVDVEASAARYRSNFGGKKAQSLSDSGQCDYWPKGTREFDGKRNKRSVWTITTKPFSEAHFATFPEDLIEPCILAGCPERGTVLDPFSGAGTTGVVSLKNWRNYAGIELNQEYIDMSRRRINAVIGNPDPEQWHKQA